MIKINVTNQVNNRSFGGTFPSQEEADAWIAKQKAKNSWGKPGEYEIEVIDLSQDPEYLAEQVKLNRQKEYQKIDDLLKEALVEQTLGDHTRMEEYLKLREQIKNKYPKV